MDPNFLMNGDANGTLGFSPEMGVGGGGTNHNTFAGKPYELTVGGESQSSRGRFGNMARKVV